MSTDRTEHQSSDELQKARDLSLEPTRPPSEVPGYQLQKFVGSGAYGEVWSALDHKTGRRVAIKFYTRRSAADVKQLATEVQKLVVLAADRYVVQLLDVGWDGQPPYYVMDYIEHGSLEDRLRSGKPMPTTEAIELFTEIANGMMHLHGKGILHCDLKPGNVLLDQDGKPRVADFGQSRLSTDETPALGTLFYMAPEQADLKALPDAKWDVYGLGALLFSMLTGKPPHYSPSLTSKIESSLDIAERLSEYRHSIQNSPPPTEHRSVPGVDRMLAEIIDRCIAANPAKRFDNIQSVLISLRQREVVRARRPVMLLGLLGPLLLTAVVTAFGWYAFREAVERTDQAIMFQAGESNKFAAKLAARSAAEQIDQYFQAINELARDESMLQDYRAFYNDADAQTLAREIAHPRLNSQQDVPKRADLVSLPLRQRLQPHLKRRLFDTTGKFPPAASWVILDRGGNQVASVFRGTNNTLGKNYSYRTYFTGLDEDLAVANESGEKTFTVTESPDQRRIIDRPHLSAVFASKQSNTWKVAFSAPIICNDVVCGVAMVSVELGDFIEFENGRNQYAMLVDSRPGEFSGAILEHPLFQQYMKLSERIPDELTESRMNVERIGDAATDFSDPLGSSEAGTKAGYHRDALAAPVPVTVSKRLLATVESQGLNASDALIKPAANERTRTGLYVIAVADKETVIAPAHELGRQLGRLSLLALIFLTLVAVGMWLLVNRMLRESRQRMEKAFAPSDSTRGSVSLDELPTIAAVDDSLKTMDRE